MEQSDEWAVSRRYFSQESRLAAERGETRPVLLTTGGEAAPT